MCHAIGVTDYDQLWHTIGITGYIIDVINLYRRSNVWNLRKYRYRQGIYTDASEWSFRSTFCTDFKSCFWMLTFPPIKTAAWRNNSWILYTFTKTKACKCGFTYLNRENKQQIDLAKCNKLRRYSFQNPNKSPSELSTTANSFEDIKTYVDEVEKPNVPPVNALCRSPQRSGKNNNLNWRGMGNINKTCFLCSGVYPHKVKCSIESRFTINAQR